MTTVVFLSVRRDRWLNSISASALSHKCLESREGLSRIGRKRVGVYLVEIAQLWKPRIFDAVSPLVLGTVFFFATQQLCGELPQAPLFVGALLYKQVYVAPYKREFEVEGACAYYLAQSVHV